MSNREVVRLALLAGTLAVVGCQRDEKQAANKPAPPQLPERALDPGFADPVAAAAALRAQPVDSWYGLYMGNKKVGYAHVTGRTTRDDEPGAFVLGLAATLESSDLGRDRLVIEEDRFYSATPPHRLIELRSSERAARGHRRVVFVAKDGKLQVTQIVDGIEQPTRTIPDTAENLSSALVYMGANPASLRVGQKATYSTFEVDDEKDEVDRVEVDSIQIAKLGGVATKVATLHVRTDGKDALNTLTVAGRGTVLKATYGASVFMKLEDKNVATTHVVGFGVVSDAVPVKRALGDPGKIKKLELIVTVAPGFKLPNVPNQKVTRLADGRYRVELSTGPAEPVSSEERRAALRVTASIDATAPEIRAKVAEIIRGATSDRQKVSRINRWIYRNLEKDLSTNLSTASQVLAKKVGDCSEHTILFIAMVRSAGIPAREVSGLIYMGDPLRSFGYHAWAEVALGGRWVPVDPSWGEDVANAAHLRLGAGTRDEWVSTLGSIAIEVP